MNLLLAQQSLTSERLPRRIPETYLLVTVFAVSAIAYCLSQWLDLRHDFLSGAFAFLGDATCGWSWLLTWALFRRDNTFAVWRLVAVLALVLSGGVSQLDNGGAQVWPVMIDRAETLLSSCLLLLALIEPLRGLRADLPRPERHFRLIFATSYGAMLVLAVVWASGSPAEAVRTTCALLAVLGMTAAVLYRARHPLPVAGKPARRTANPMEVALGARILDCVTQDRLYTDSDLKLADLARRLGEPDYRVSQSLTRALGFRNVNHLLNHFRLEAAKASLADPTCALPVLTIALDCGFGSIGPFNRAFKAETGMTPTQYRDAHRKDGTRRQA